MTGALLEQMVITDELGECRPSPSRLKSLDSAPSPGGHLGNICTAGTADPAIAPPFLDWHARGANVVHKRTGVCVCLRRG